tara:strand:- start:673 stop:1176 length:504 start_codon:yes stop_codon:yes gene_type:complete
MQKNVKDFFQYLIKSDSEKDSLKLIDIIYSKFHNSEVCLVQLAGKNAFPVYKTSEILNNKKILNAFSREDILLVKDLDNKIKEREKKHKILEVNPNGTILLKNAKGQIKRYAEKFISSNPSFIDSLASQDAHSIGYRVGYRDGIQDGSLARSSKYEKIKNSIKNLFS